MASSICGRGSDDETRGEEPYCRYAASIFVQHDRVSFQIVFMGQRTKGPTEGLSDS